MKAMERNVMRLVAVQHLRAAHGIKTKNWNKNKAGGFKSATSSSSAKVFGVPLENLPYYNMECGSVPSFLVDACMKLLAHVDTEGLFRKSGSVVRLKALRAKLDSGEECLSTALPCDVAGLVKQFFRELPEPVLPTELQDAFLKAQQLPTEEDRTSATMLLSCVLPDKSLSVLRHFFDFLQNVSKRSSENKMDSSNLSVILAPNLLHSGDGTEKMNANTEKRLKLQAAIIHRFIEHAEKFGELPQFLAEKVPAMMGCEVGLMSPNGGELEEFDINSGMKKRHRRSFGVFSSATPVIATPSSKRKLPLESGHSFGFSNKKRRSVKKSLGIELLPNSLFNGTSTPGSAYSASGVLDASQNTLSSAGRSRRQSATSVRRQSRRLSSRNAINRVESGRAGCFSPKAGKKEAPRKSLRLRFSLGRSHKEAGSESIGWRLATQESTTSFRLTKETGFSPSVRPRNTETKSVKYMSKSEDNLLTPQCDSSAHRTSWSGETPVGAQAFGGGSFTDTPMNMVLKSNYLSEPAIVTSKPPTASSLQKKLCCASSAESLESESSVFGALGQSTPTLLRVPQPSTELVCGLQAVTQESSSKPSDSILLPPPRTPATKAPPTDTFVFATPQSRLANHQNITFGQIDIAALSPLHIDSVVLESGAPYSPAVTAVHVSSQNNSVMGEGGKEEEEEQQQVNCSRLIDALDIQSPAHFKLGVSSGQQSTPYRAGIELDDEPDAACLRSTVSAGYDEPGSPPEGGAQAQNLQPLSPHSQEMQKARVADHIQHFNTLTLNSPRGLRSQEVRSPLKFQRTPVRQTVRRINSLMGESRRPVRNLELSAAQGAMFAKAVSLESGLSPRLQPRPKKKPPPVPPKKTSTLARKPKAGALGDVTNKVQTKNKADLCVSDVSGAQTPLLQQVAERDTQHYRGSPRNPLCQGRLLSATKPVDL